MNFRLFAGLALTGILLLVLFGGFTWRLFPLIVMVPTLGWVIYRERVGIMVLILAFLSFGCTLFVYFLFPVVSFPKPTGPYGVGVRYEVVHTGRPEIMTPDSTDFRTLYLKIWYPAEKGTTRTKYIEGGMEGIERLAEILNLPPLVFSQMLRTKTNSYVEPAPAKGTFPILTYSHGYGSFFGQNTPLMEQLASEGYMVAAICHSHQALFGASAEDGLVRFPEIVPLQVRPDSTAEKAYESTLETSVSQERLNAYSDRYFKGLREINSWLDIWAQDIVSTIKYIENRSRDPEADFYKQITTETIVSIGMSFGGAATVEAALLEPKIKAAVNMDGSQYGEVLVDSLQANVLLLEAARNINGLSMYGHVFDNIQGSVHSMQFANAKHLNFSDLNLFSPAFKYLGIVGEVDGHTMSNRITTIVSGFIQQQFTEQPFDARSFAIPEEVIIIR